MLSTRGQISGQQRAAPAHPTYDFIPSLESDLGHSREHLVATSPGCDTTVTAAPLLCAAVVIAMRPPGRSR
ncbi:hypothetical protein AA0117_g11362 [Alternaria alternata]|uniref:Uncharacterized protein n=1 Tax=Alternaria alternata TaxID=5599 RepID=A0A4Q4N2P8_ALTAL|nr:hypothetical protein AA0117_g11362 [Alternaria alternata]